jgi:hypothetical protein
LVECLWPLVAALGTHEGRLRRKWKFGDRGGYIGLAANRPSSTGLSGPRQVSGAAVPGYGTTRKRVHLELDVMETGKRKCNHGQRKKRREKREHECVPLRAQF